MVEKKEELSQEASVSLASPEGSTSSAAESSSKTALAEHDVPRVTLVESAPEAPSASNSESDPTEAPLRAPLSRSLGQIGDYDLLEELSTTPVARFYRAYSKTVQKDVAIKVIRPEICQDATLLKRFRQEAKAASQVDHPNLCSIYDFGVTEAGCAYVVTDFLQGCSLKDLIAREGFLDPERALDIFKQVCHGLSHLHEHDLVHRNLTPSNIFLVDTEGSHDFVKVVDFGIGRIVNATSSDGESAEPEPYANPRYMSPEQLMGYKLDARSDIYSIGLLLYEALCGKAPHGQQNRMQTIMKQLNAKPRPFRTVSSDLEISAHLEQIVFKCLEKNRSARYSSVSDLCMDLDLCAGNSLPNEKHHRRSLKSFGRHKGDSHKKWRRPLVFIAIAAVAFGSMAGTYSFWKELRRQNNAPAWLMNRPGVFPMRQWRHIPYETVMHQADFSFDKGNYPEAIELYTQTINIYRRHNRIDESAAGAAQANDPALVGLYTQLGRSYMQNSYERIYRGTNVTAPYTDPTSYRNAETAFENAMKFHGYTFGPKDLDLLNGIAGVKFLLHDHLAAIATHQQILDILKSAPEPIDQISNLNSIGLNYLDLGDYGEAEKYLRQAVDTAKKYQGIKNVHASYAAYASDLPKALIGQGKFGKAEWWAKENIKWIMDSQPVKGVVTKDIESLRTNYDSLAEALTKKGKLAEAEKAAAMAHNLE